jgi:hypothetical protein
MNVNNVTPTKGQPNFLRMDDYKSLNGWSDKHEAAYQELIRYANSPDEFDESKFVIKEIKTS